MSPIRLQEGKYRAKQHLTIHDLFVEADKLVGDYFEWGIKEVEFIEEGIELRKRLQDRDELFKYTFNKSWERIQETVYDFIINHTHKAAVNSKEFNYDLFIDKLDEAILAHKSEIVKLTPNEDEKQIEVKIDFTPLGDVELYGLAVARVRDTLGTQGGEERAIQRSKMWREKIYKTGREGAALFRSKFNKETGKEEEKEITSIYAPKYRETIDARLSFLPEGTAPFWYLIEHGSVPLGKSDIGGEAYPIVPASGFIRTMEEGIARSFKDIYNTLYDSIKTLLGQSIIDDLNIDLGQVKSPEEAFLRISDEIPKLAEDRRFIEWESRKRIGLLDASDRSYEFYKTRLSARAKGTGRFIKVRSD